MASAAAECRSSAPSANENSAIVARYTAVPTSGRIISGSVTSIEKSLLSKNSHWSSAPRARPRRGRPTNTETTSTMALAQSTGRRLGAAVRLDRIMPVLYSLVMVERAQHGERELPSVTATVNGASGSPTVLGGRPAPGWARSRSPG